MHRNLFGVVVALALLLPAGCKSNRKLSQVSAENTIRAFIASHNRSSSPLEEVFNSDSVVRISPVSQFADNEASTIVKFKDLRQEPFALKFVFQKNIDEKWFLTKLEPVGPPDGPDPGRQGWESMIIDANQNLSMPVADPTPNLRGKVSGLFARRNPLVGHWQCVKTIAKFSDGTQKTTEQLPYRLIRSFSNDGTYEIVQETTGRPPFIIKGSFAFLDESHFSQTITQAERRENIGHTGTLEFRINGQELVIAAVPYYGNQVVRNPVIHTESHFTPIK